jgi:hypothetical protein
LSSCDGFKNSTTPHVGKHVPTQSRTSCISLSPGIVSPLQHALGILQLPRKNNPHLHIVEFDVSFAQNSTKNPKCMIDGEQNISMMADYT